MNITDMSLTINAYFYGIPNTHIRDYVDFIRSAFIMGLLYVTIIHRNVQLTCQIKPADSFNLAYLSSFCLFSELKYTILNHSSSFFCNKYNMLLQLNRLCSVYWMRSSLFLKRVILFSSIVTFKVVIYSIVSSIVLLS